MDPIKRHYLQVIKASKALESMLSLARQKTIIKGDAETEAFRDATIKRFEFSYELMWKYLKKYLTKKYGLIERSPKAVIRECFKAKLFNHDEIDKLIKMVDDRNSTTHIYDEEEVSAIFENIPEYFELVLLIIDRAKPE